MSSSQNKDEKGEKANSNMVLDDNDIWDNYTIVTWDYEGANVIYLSEKEEGKYHVDIAQLLEDLLYKDIFITFYVTSELVVDGE
jgi:hypothetical protein